MLGCLISLARYSSNHLSAAWGVWRCSSVLNRARGTWQPSVQVCLCMCRWFISLDKSYHERMWYFFQFMGQIKGTYKHGLSTPAPGRLDHIRRGSGLSSVAAFVKHIDIYGESSYLQSLPGQNMWAFVWQLQTALGGYLAWLHGKGGFRDVLVLW